MQPFIKILQPGVFASYQDQGRRGKLRYGISPSGFVDKVLAGNTNRIMGNPPSTCCVEFCRVSPVMEFLVPCTIGVGMVNGRYIINGHKMELTKGPQLLTLSKEDTCQVILEKSMYGYISISGGWVCREDISSRSHHSLSGLGEERLQKGSLLYPVNKSNGSIQVSSRLKSLDYNNNVIGFCKAPEYGLFKSSDLAQIFQSLYIDVQTSRMGIKLKPLQVIPHTHSITSSPVLPGTIQMTPDGTFIVLGPDGQTIGGYPRIGVLSEKHMAVLYQKPPGSQVSFSLLE